MYQESAAKSQDLPAIESIWLNIGNSEFDYVSRTQIRYLLALLENMINGNKWNKNSEIKRISI